ADRAGGARSRARATEGVAEVVPALLAAGGGASVRVERAERVAGDVRLAVARRSGGRERAGGGRSDEERPAAVPVGVGREAAEGERRRRRRGRVDLGDVAGAGGALVADVVGELFAVLVAVA